MTSLSGDRHPSQQLVTLDLFTVHANSIDPPDSSGSHRIPNPRRVSAFIRVARAKDNISDPFMSIAYNVALRPRRRTVRRRVEISIVAGRPIKRTRLSFSFVVPVSLASYIRWFDD